MTLTYPGGRIGTSEASVTNGRKVPLSGPLTHCAEGPLRARTHPIAEIDDIPRPRVRKLGQLSFGRRSCQAFA